MSRMSSNRGRPRSVTNARVLPRTLGRRLNRCIHTVRCREHRNVPAPLPCSRNATMPVRAIANICSFALISLLAACTALTSTTRIEPGKAFRLGGGQPGAFLVRGSNTGSVAVVVFSEVAGKRDSIVTLAPGAPVDARFESNAMAIFMNTSSTRTAIVAIKVTGDISALRMGYEPNVKR